MGKHRFIIPAIAIAWAVVLWLAWAGSLHRVIAPVAVLITTYAGLAVHLADQNRRRETLDHCRKTGCCLACGYDLTGNLSGVCSECGTRWPRRAAK